MLANDPIAMSYDLSSVRRVSCAAAPACSDVIERVRRRLNVPAITQGTYITLSQFRHIAMAKEKLYATSWYLEYGLVIKYHNSV